MPFYIAETMKKGIYHNDYRPDDRINNCTHYNKNEMLDYYDAFTSVHYKVKRINNDGSITEITGKWNL